MKNDSIERLDRLRSNKVFFDKNIRSLSFREVVFLRNYFEEERLIFFKDTVNTSQADLKESLIRGLCQNNDFQTLTETALSEMASQLIPQDRFKWLVNDIRAQAFVLGVVAKQQWTLGTPKGFSDDLMPEIYKLFDGQPLRDKILSLEDKLGALNEIYASWQKVLKLDNYSKWLDLGDENQIAWTRDYLRSKNVYTIININSLDTKKVRAVSLASIDIIDLHININSQGPRPRPKPEIYYSRKLFIDKMKRAWSQQKYRNSGKTKKPYHLPLTKQTKVRLEKMAKVKGFSQTVMLDILINSEYQLKFLDVDGNELY